MSSVIGPFTPTTPTVLIDCQAFALLLGQDLSALYTDGWPRTFLCTNIGTAGSFFDIVTFEYVTTIDPAAGNYLMPGQSMILTINEGNSPFNTLLGGSFGFGATAISVTGGLNQ
jgi:hypothetical protein